MARLIDADALKHAICIDECGEEKSCGACRWVDFVDDAQTIGGWISAKDRMPEENGEYLVLIKTGCITICWYDGQKWLDSDECEWAEGYVSHWAALPKPPEVDE